MENFDNKKTTEGGAPSENKGDRRPHYKKHYHHRSKNRAPKPEAEAAAQVTAAPEAEPKSSQPSRKSSRNRHKKHHNNQNRTAAPVKAPETEAVKETTAQPQQKNQPRHRQKDKPRKSEQPELLTSLPENDLDFLPSRSDSDSDFLTLGKIDDKILDSMPKDPTLDAVFAEVEIAEANAPDGPEIVGIRFEHGSKVYYFDPRGKQYKLGTHAIVETAQGLEYGEVVISNRIVSADQVVSPLRPVIRQATKEDVDHHEDNRRRQNEAFKICLAKIDDHGLDMKLVECQYTFDNSKLIFFFTSAGRVDFRALVKDLASVFRTRIELRQIGIRDEARMVGGFGVCGRKLCCAGFLPNFVQVSIKMAKEQGLSINASKISGTCGRLMCCLRYEQEAYEREIALMPPTDSVVDTPDGRGVVIDIFPISGNVKVRLNDKQDAAPKNYHMSTIKVIRAAENKKSSDKDSD